MILVVFGIAVLVGQALNIALCLALDQIFSPVVGALAFVVLYILVFVGAWILSLRIVEGRQKSRQESSRQEFSRQEFWGTATSSR